jgi:hypothetical protein
MLMWPVVSPSTGSILEESTDTESSSLDAEANSGKRLLDAVEYSDERRSMEE